MYERIFRKSSIFTPGSNIPTMLPGKKSASYNIGYKNLIAVIYELFHIYFTSVITMSQYTIFCSGRGIRIKKVT